MRIRTNATSFALAFLLTISVASIYSQPAQLAGLDEYIEKARQEWKVPGMAVAIVKDDKIVYSKGFGVKKLGENNPVDDKTLFAIGSSSSMEPRNLESIKWLLR